MILQIATLKLQGAKSRDNSVIRTRICTYFGLEDDTLSHDISQQLRPYHTLSICIAYPSRCSSIASATKQFETTAFHRSRECINVRVESILKISDILLSPRHVLCKQLCRWKLLIGETSNFNMLKVGKTFSSFFHVFDHQLGKGVKLKGSFWCR